MASDFASNIDGGAVDLNRRGSRSTIASNLKYEMGST